MRAIICYVAVAILVTTVAGAGPSPPIRVTATHSSGAITSFEDDVDAFQISITPDGKASISTVREVHRGKKHMNRTTLLAPAQLDGIARAVTTNRFFELPPAMEGGATDSPTYILDITIGTKHKKVLVYAPAFYDDKRFLRRFRLIWAAVSRAVGFTEDPDALHHLTVNS
jgi:hypothetical protein